MDSYGGSSWDWRSGAAIAVLVALFWLCLLAIDRLVTPATAADGLPWGVTCAMVRAKVAEHGETVALAYAERNYTPSQVRAARRCLQIAKDR